MPNVIEKVNKMYEFYEALKPTEKKGLFGWRKKKEKEFKIPKEKKLKRLLKKNYAMVFFLRNNRSLDINMVPIENDMIYMKESNTYHAANAEYILKYKKYPVMIVPEWSLLPFSSKEHSELSDTAGLGAKAQKVIINATKLAQLKEHKGMGGKTILWIIIGGAILLYFISKVLGVKI